MLKEVESYFTKKALSFLVAETNGELVGFSVSYELELDKFPRLRGVVALVGDTIYGDELGVDKDFRGNGIGTKLMKERFRKYEGTSYRLMVGRTDVKSQMVPLYMDLSYVDLAISDPDYPTRNYFGRLLRGPDQQALLREESQLQSVFSGGCER